METPGERIKWALEQRGLSAAQLARDLGVTRSAVCQWWAKQKPTSPRRKLEQIAERLNLHIDWLLAGQGEPMCKSFEGADFHEPLTDLLNIACPRIVGVIEGEAWRDGPHPNLCGSCQVAFEVRGSSASSTVHPGEYVICVDYQHIRPAGPHPGDLVVVKKRRGTDEYKIFVARLHYREKSWELHYEFNDLRWQHERPIRLSNDLAHDTIDHSPIEIIGYVLGAFRANPQPQWPCRTVSGTSKSPDPPCRLRNSA